ncbi:hypothetical protein DMUE_2588 [Dictyocoela muelleri]|nr:hypothetical protein DMUE_2588 [Dictyocoela muelleri]
MYKYTFENGIFRQYSDFNYSEKLLLFTTNDNINILNKTKIWLGEGTLHSAPKNLNKIYIIHSLYFEKVLTLCYILMENRKEISYKKIFNYLTENIVTEPEYYIIDFEIAQYNLIKKKIKNTALYGCNLHFTQIMIRYIQKSGYLYLYKNNIEYKRFIKYLLMQAYVPIKNVISEFEKLKEIKKDFKEYNDAFEYFRDHFIINNKNIKTMQISFWGARPCGRPRPRWGPYNNFI